MKELNLIGKIALVTGAGQGIGRQVALSLAGAGVGLIVADLDITEEDDVCKEIVAFGVDCLPLCCNVADEDAVEEMFKTVAGSFGRLDILVNNAGITNDGMARKMGADQFRAVTDVNLLGSFLCARQALTAMRETGGSIINFSSIAGFLGNMGQVNYSAAKSGIIGMTKTLALEGARDNIRVNAVVPGFIDTHMTQAMPEVNKLAAIEKIPLRRMGTTEDIANAVLFLASDFSSFVTGHALHVNGGRYM